MFFLIFAFIAVTCFEICCIDMRLSRNRQSTRRSGRRRQLRTPTQNSSVVNTTIDPVVESSPNDVEDGRDLLSRSSMASFVKLLTVIGVVSHFMSTAGGNISMKSVKMYISRFQHFMLYCQQTSAQSFHVTDRHSFLVFFEVILEHMSDWLPSYATNLSDREDLAADTVRNIVNHTLAIAKWYLIFGSSLREETGMTAATANMLWSQVSTVCHQLSRQLSKATRKLRAVNGKDLMEFKVCRRTLCVHNYRYKLNSPAAIDLEQRASWGWSSGIAACRPRRREVLCTTTRFLCRNGVD